MDDSSSRQLGLQEKIEKNKLIIIVYLLLVPYLNQYPENISRISDGIC
ncbi:hypothetical protein [Enterococcus sp. AZ128]